MALEKIKVMLKETIGLYSRSIGDASIERAIRHRMLVLGIQGDMEYLLRLENDGEEFDELIEEVVVPETWFFRNVSPFEALASYLPVLRQERSDNPDAELKILSLPCSTGEEPYSIAMVLMEMDLPIGRFSIDALDVSQRAIRKAKRAIYGRNSFREEFLGLRDKYFKRTGAGYQLMPEVKEHVRFSRANIITDSFDQDRQRYDVIFCRNLLIYFDRPTQTRVLEKLRYMLQPKGILCVGHAEAAQVSKHFFLPMNIPMAFAFRQNDGEQGPASDGAPSAGKAATTAKKTLKDLESAFHNLANLVEKDRKVSSRLSGMKAATQDTSVDHGRTDMKPVTTERGRQDDKPASIDVDESTTFEKVSSYLELGRLADAAMLCESCLKLNPESADAYYYLGLISHLQGGPGAAESLLKKAVYLDPSHHLAIGLLALLADKRGDAGQAEDYRRRQKRAMRRNSDADG